MEKTHDIRAGRLTPDQYNQNFCDIHPPLDLKKAAIESSRCYFCHDAPCIDACPTGINIPEFIRRINTGNAYGAGTEILDANILGGTCARVCPVEILCEHACVRNTSEDKPVKIGLLQRFATDAVFTQTAKTKQHPFEREKTTGKKIAIMGAGPAGLSAAHRLAQLGHDVEIFESKPKSGGLNEYGIAVYKMLDDFAQKEISFLMGIGGIKIHHNQVLGKNIKLNDIRKRFDAVFLAIGLNGVNALKLEGEDYPHVVNAVDYIAELRQSPYAKMPTGKHVVVIGGGNTAIDIAIQSKALGAEYVTLVYRRGTENMSATSYEQELAQTHGVQIITWAKPVKIIGSKEKGVTAIEFEKMKLNTKKELEGTGEIIEIKADMIFKAVGQLLTPHELGDGLEALELTNGKIKVDENKKTSLDNVYAGGDCIAHPEDLTVAAVQDGKIAALAIHQKLTGEIRSAKGIRIGLFVKNPNISPTPGVYANG